jgi:hypothetical protein
VLYEHLTETSTLKGKNMRNWKTFLMTFLVGASASYGSGYSASEIIFEAGYRRDDVNLTIQAPSCDPLIKVSSDFDNVDIFQIGLRAKTDLGCNFYGRASAAWGWVFDGDNREEFKLFIDESSDFIGSGQLLRQVDSESVIDERHTIDFDIAIGYSCHFCDCAFEVSPVLGYAVNEQNFSVEDSRRVELIEESSSSVCGSIFPIVSRDCCAEKHIFRWYGPFVGLDFRYKPLGECWNLYAEVEYHFGHVKIKRHDFSELDGFDGNRTNSRHAHGWSVLLGGDYQLCNCWTLGLNFSFTDRTATKHHCKCISSSQESFFGSADSYEPEFRTRVKWRSFAVNATVGWEF